ncbi:hypothetical protein REPUB_Repub03eG0188100 [Reevesia pubescens]
MEQILNLIEVDSSNSTIKVSITESTMMQILHSAMDKAYRKVKSKNGVLERLNEISKFYELAVMQLEGCLKFVQEETDNYFLDTNHRVLLEDLTEIRDRLQGRLKEVQLAISDKDKELLERLGNELKLRKALEISEKELDTLHADLKLEQKRKSEDIEELFLGNQASTDNGDREGEFCELKHSVDQQVWNIQQQLEPNYQLRDEERSQGIDNKKIEQMGSDISILKETLDLAFCKMQNAIFLSELGPIEHQWVWNIERGITAIVIKSSLRDFRENFDVEVKKRELQVSAGLRKLYSDVMREINCLNHELQHLSNQDEVQVKSLKAKGSLNAKGMCLSESKSFGNSRNFSLKVEQASTMKQPCNEVVDDDGSHYVAKMIKNHESIIRKKSEELNLLTQELLPEKACLPRREKDPVNLKRSFQEVIVSLESLINWSPGIGDIFCDGRYDYEVEMHPKVRLFTDDQMDIEKSGIDSMEEVWAKVNKTSVSHAGNEEPCSEMRILKQEMEDTNLQTMMMEETYLTLIKSLVDEFHIEMLNLHLHCLIKEGMYETFMEDIKDEWIEKTRSDQIEVQSREEKYDTVFTKATKDLDAANNSRAENDQNAKAESNCLEESEFIGLGNLEGMLKEDVYTFLLQEILGEWNENIESYKSIGSLGEELCFIVFGETVKDIMNTANYALSKLQEIKVLDGFNYDFQFNNKFFDESAAMSIKDDVLKVFLAEMIKELQMKIYAFSIENLIREEVLQFVIFEAVKEACTFEEADDQNQEPSSNNSLISVDKLWTSPGENEKENLTQSASHLPSKRFSPIPKTSLVATTPCRKPSIYQEKDIEEMKLNIYESLLTPIDELSKALKSFECKSCTRLGRHILRLDEIKLQLDLLVELTSSFIQKESLYKTAFIRRCENLQMAETEVDLLGDQVDLLQGLLKKIYITLYRLSPVLQQYFEVSEMLKLIEKEIGGK